MNQIKKWFSIIRPKTLFASAVPVLIAILLAFKLENISLLNSILVLLCGVSLQVLSNLINDYYDFKKGLDKQGRLGPKRALAEGTVTEIQMRNAIIINIVFSVLTGLYLVIVGGMPILLIGVLSIFFAWLYTATSHSLSYLGIADIFAFTFYGPIATFGTFYILTHSFSSTVIYAGCVCGLVSTMILCTNNLRDISADKQVGKKTIPVRFGKKIGELEYLLCALLTSVFAYLAFSLSVTMLIGAFALLVYGKVKKAEGVQYNKCLFLSSLLNMVYFLLVLIHLLF